MNPFIWCAVGAVVGWIGGGMLPARGPVSRIENMLVAIFGAFIGGEFLASFLEGAAASGLRASAVGLGIAGAAVMLVLLGAMRAAVGPMRSHKRKPSR